MFFLTGAIIDGDWLFVTNMTTKNNSLIFQINIKILWKKVDFDPVCDGRKFYFSA